MSQSMVVLLGDIYNGVPSLAAPDPKKRSALFLGSGAARLWSAQLQIYTKIIYSNKTVTVNTPLVLITVHSYSNITSYLMP